MDNLIILNVPCVPVAQPRQRHRVINTKSGKSFVHNYTPKSDPVNTFKSTIQLELKNKYTGPVLCCPIIMDVCAIFPRPQTKIYKGKEMPRYPHTSKPDRDNVLKAVQDSLEGLLYRNDSQIYGGKIEKFVASGYERPCVIINVSY